MRFLIVIEYSDMEARERTVDAHRSYIAAARAEGIVVESGPFLDGAGGMYVLDVRDEAEAKSFVDDDPYRKFGHLRFTIRAFQSAFTKPAK
jgi:uncharacterized protein YciI